MKAARSDTLYLFAVKLVETGENASPNLISYAEKSKKSKIESYELIS